jgi:hypothetical protein
MHDHAIRRVIQTTVGSRSFADVSCLLTLRPLRNFKLYCVAFLKTFVSFRIDGTVVHEYIRAILTPNETIPLGVIEPLNGSFQSIHLKPPGTNSFAAEAVPTDFAVIVRL